MTIGDLMGVRSRGRNRAHPTPDRREVRRKRLHLHVRLSRVNGRAHGPDPVKNRACCRFVLSVEGAVDGPLIECLLSSQFLEHRDTSSGFIRLTHPTANLQPLPVDRMFATPPDSPGQCEPGLSDDRPRDPRFCYCPELSPRATRSSSS